MHRPDAAAQGKGGHHHQGLATVLRQRGDAVGQGQAGERRHEGDRDRGGNKRQIVAVIEHAVILPRNTRMKTTGWSTAPILPRSPGDAAVTGDFPTAAALALPADQARAARAAAGAEHHDLTALAGQDQLVPAVAGQRPACVIALAKAFAFGCGRACAGISRDRATFADDAGPLAAEGFDRDRLTNMAGRADALAVANGAAVAGNVAHATAALPVVFLGFAAKDIGQIVARQRDAFATGTNFPRGAPQIGVAEYAVRAGQFAALAQKPDLAFGTGGCIG